MEAQAQAHEAPALIVDSLSKAYGKKYALDNVSFVVPRASLTVILGAAGAGKTTTLRCIAGLEQPEAGCVILDGNDVGGWEPKDRDVAMIFDNLALYPNKSGFANIASPLVVRGEDKATVEKKVMDLSATLRITHILGRLPKTMSGGERQRVALGRALIRTPKLFLLDEPLSSLDAKLRIDLRAELKRLQRERGFSFLLATPDFNEALAIGDTVVMLREGQVVQIAEPQTLYDKPVDRETALFIGAPQINLVPAEYDGEAGTVKAAGAAIPAPAELARDLGGKSRTFELGIRPENLALTGPGKGALLAEIIDIEPLGLKSVLTVRNKEAELRLLVASTVTESLSVGQQADLDLTNTAMLLAFDPQTGLRLHKD